MTPLSALSTIGRVKIMTDANWLRLGVYGSTARGPRVKWIRTVSRAVICKSRLVLVNRVAPDYDRKHAV